MALKEEHGGRDLEHLAAPTCARREPAGARARRAPALADARRQAPVLPVPVLPPVGRAAALRATQRGIRIIGDIPIFVAHDSADVWAQPATCSCSTRSGKPTVVAGVPPDYFSADRPAVGQPALPLGRAWRSAATPGGSRGCRMALDAWSTCVRLDHFRGFDALLGGPGAARDRGERPLGAGPGRRTSSTRCATALGDLPIIAEDLGRHHARRRGAARRVRLARHEGAAVRLRRRRRPTRSCRTTTRSTASSTPARTTTTRPPAGSRKASPEERTFVQRYFARSGEDVSFDFIRGVMASCADTAIVAAAGRARACGSEARMNIPGVADGQLAVALPRRRDRRVARRAARATWPSCTGARRRSPTPCKKPSAATGTAVAASTVARSTAPTRTRISRTRIPTRQASPRTPQLARAMATPFVTAGAGFLLAVLRFDLMFDVQVLGRRADDVPEAAIASIAAYYRRVTTAARPMNLLVASPCSRRSAPSSCRSHAVLRRAGPRGARSSWSAPRCCSRDCARCRAPSVSGHGSIRSTRSRWVASRRVT